MSRHLRHADPVAFGARPQVGALCFMYCHRHVDGMRDAPKRARHRDHECSLLLLSFGHIDRGGRRCAQCDWTRSPAGGVRGRAAAGQSHVAGQATEGSGGDGEDTVVTWSYGL